MLSRLDLGGRSLADHGATALAGEQGARVAVTIAGTQPAEWSVTIGALKAALGDRVALRLEDDLGALDGLRGEERCIFLVEHPGRPLARWIASAGDGSAEHILRMWRDSALRLLRRAHRSPTHCLMIDAAEAFANPNALAHTVARWCALPPPTSAIEPSAAGAPDALCEALAAHLCASEPDYSALFDEIYASTDALAGASPAGDSPFAGDSERAVARYRELIVNERELGRHMLQLARLESTAETARDALAAQVAEASASRSDRVRAEVAAAGRGADADFLLSQIVETYAMLESEHLRSEQEVGRAASAERESSALRQRLAEMQTQAESLLAARARAENATHLLRSERDALEGQRAALQSRLAEREQLVDTLKVQGARMQAMIAWHEGTTGPVPSPAPALRVVSSHDEAPHRHLHLLVDAQEIDGRSAPPAEVRLLDHHGQPGLAVFDQGGPTFLGDWRPHGREGDRDYMLFVPADQPGRQALQRLGTTDWQRLCFVTVLVTQHLIQSSGATSAWAGTAQRLVRSLQAMPARLRHDGLRFDGAADGAGSVDIVFERCSHGHRSLDDVRLRWHPRAGRLLWERSRGVPLAAWPTREDGALDDRFELPVGRMADTARWRSIVPADRELLLALLDALPAAVERMPGSAAPEGFSPPSLAAAAVRLHRQARRAQRACIWRTWLRRALRRPPQD